MDGIISTVLSFFEMEAKKVYSMLSHMSILNTTYVVHTKSGLNDCINQIGSLDQFQSIAFSYFDGHANVSGMLYQIIFGGKNFQHPLGIFV